MGRLSTTECTYLPTYLVVRLFWFVFWFALVGWCSCLLDVQV